MYIGFIRHGETDWARTGRLQGREDIPLNEQGRQQIETLARALKGGHWAEVYCSPLSRAKESAAIIATALNLDQPTVLPDLMERDFGQAAGLTPDERKARFPAQAYPGMESEAALQHRVKQSLNHIAQAATLSTDRKDLTGGDQAEPVPAAAPAGVLVITHGGWLHELANLYSPEHAQNWRQVRLKLAGFSLARLADGKLTFLCFNQSAADITVFPPEPGREAF